MKKIYVILISMLFLLTLSHFAFAEEYYQQQPNSGYSTSSTSPEQRHADNRYENRRGPDNRSQERFKKERDRFSISVNLGGNEPVYVTPPVIVKTSRFNRRHGRFGDVQWVGMVRGDRLPEEAVIGGGERSGELFVCRANYNGGVHPGKLVGTSCNIPWGGNEVVLSRYQVLVSPYTLNWVSASFGNIPMNAVRGGNEDNGRPLFVCQARYAGGMHPGKVVGRNCDIAWGGREVGVPYYNVLVR